MLFSSVCSFWRARNLCPGFLVRVSARLVLSLFGDGGDGQTRSEKTGNHVCTDNQRCCALFCPRKYIPGKGFGTVAVVKAFVIG